VGERADFHTAASLAAPRVIEGRQHRRCTVLVTHLIEDARSNWYRVRASCDHGVTWGWHRISRHEIVQAMLDVAYG
jgi:hypothetical protein